jgi:putative ABC transport system permease protein
MLFHYLKLARKALFKNKYYTIINVFGLTCGMLTVLIIAKYIGFSLQLDGFHLLKDRIYIVNHAESINGSDQHERSSTYWGVGELLEQFPEVASATRYNQHVEAVMIAENGSGEKISFTENKIFVTDSSFLRIFSFSLVNGDERTALSRPNSVVMTKSASMRYFGDTNPIGKTLNVRVAWGQETMYEVTGVLKDVPKLSRFSFDFLTTPDSDIEAQQLWDSPDYSMYVLMNENANGEELAHKLTATLRDVADLRSNNRNVILSMESITDPRLSITEYLLVAVAIFIAVVCWVNYINQVIAQSYWRVKEVSMLRVMGATKHNLRNQFVIESSLICVFSLLLIIAIYSALEKQLFSFSNGHLLPLIAGSAKINVFFLGIFVIGIIVVAAIPTGILFSSGFGTALRDVHGTKIGKVGLRKALVIVQFSVSTVLMICIFVISNQLEYLDSKDKGVNMRNVLVVKAPMARDTTWNVKRKMLQVFKNRCAGLPLVSGVASSTVVPGEEYRHETYLSAQGASDKFLVHQNGVDDNYFRLYEVEFVAGRDFVPDSRFENNASIILNESAARGLGIYDLDKAIGSGIVDHESGDVFNLIGIVKDFHQTPLKYQMEPTAFRFNVFRGHVSMRIKTAGMDTSALDESIAKMKQTWSELYRDSAFDYYFLDEKYVALNMEDQYVRKLFYGFTVLSVIISCLGLFGMSLLVSEKRQKEIGIRKVFGASVGNILAIFFGGYVGSLLTAVVIGVPLGYWLMTLWLRDFTYRTEIGSGLLVIAVLTIILIFIFTVSYHTIKAALTNPVKVLRG